MSCPASLATVLLVAAIAAACPASEGTRAAELRHRELAAASEATPAERDHGFAQRAELIAQLKQELADTQADLDRISAQVDRSGVALSAQTKSASSTARERAPSP